MKTVFYLLMLLFLISCKSTSVNIKEIGVIDRQQKSGIKFYENGEYEKAFHELSELAAWGYKDSQYALAFMFLKGLYVEQSILIGMGWLGVAAESNIEEWTALFDKLYSSATDEDKSKYFIAPAKLNEPKICADGSDWEGGYFPFD